MNWALIAMALAIPPGAASIVDGAIADAQQRFGVKAEVLDVQAVDWPDMSMGCPQKGMRYPQRLVPGWRIVLSADGRTFEYHAAEKGAAFHCPPGRAQKPLPSSTI